GRVLSDALWGVAASVALVAGRLLYAMAYDKLEVALRPRGVMILALILIGSPALVCLSHFIAVWLTGLTAARSAHLSLADYVNRTPTNNMADECCETSGTKSSAIRSRQPLASTSLPPFQSGLSAKRLTRDSDGARLRRRATALTLCIWRRRLRT